MTLTFFWPLLLGTVVPAVTAFVTKQHASPKLKALLTALLAGISGALSGFVLSPPHGSAQWSQVIGSILLTWVTAGATYLTGWKPTGAAARIAAVTPHFGLGSEPASAPPAAA